MKDVKMCCICGQVFVGFGNNPWPVSYDEDAVCCNDCNAMYVIPARIERMYGSDSGTKQS